MKRFYKDATVEAVDGGFAIMLDGRQVKTPARGELTLPNAALADAAVAEWNGQGDKVDLTTMPVNGLANAAIDRIGTERETIRANVAAYGESDMLCYRGDTGEPLTERQAVRWDPVLEWARTRYDVSFQIVHGIIHQPQPEETVKRLSDVVGTLDDFTLAAMARLVSLTGSLVASLALVEQAQSAEALWPLVNLEELWQVEQWGEDYLATETRELKQAEFADLSRFLELVRS